MPGVRAMTILQLSCVKQVNIVLHLTHPDKITGYLIPLYNAIALELKFEYIISKYGKKFIELTDSPNHNKRHSTKI